MVYVCIKRNGSSICGIVFRIQAQKNNMSNILTIKDF